MSVASGWGSSSACWVSGATRPHPVLRYIAPANPRHGGGGGGGRKRAPLPPGAPGTDVSGLVLVDKPAGNGWTSHDVVSKVRRLAGTRKVGHAGTLDPMASGLLVIGFNKATRLLTHITGADKTYLATIRLGVTTTTEDAEGEVLATKFANAVTEDRIRDGIATLTGDIMQVPSKVSAIKVDGKRSYQRVRDGEEVELQARPITVHRFELNGMRRLDSGAIVDIDVEVDCSSGTYIRALARDLGEYLEVGGHLTALRRTHVGPFSVDNARTLDELAERFDYSELSQAASDLFPVREVSFAEAVELSHGRRLSPTTQEPDRDAPPLSAARNPAGTVIALIENTEHHGQPVAAPSLVFVTDQDVAAGNAGGDGTHGA